MDPWHVVEILGSAFGVVSLAISGWALNQVVNLKADHSALKATIEANQSETLRRFDELLRWMKGLGERLDRLVEKKD